MTSATADGSRAVGPRGVPLPRVLFGTAPLATASSGDDEASAVAAVGRVPAVRSRG